MYLVESISLDNFGKCGYSRILTIKVHSEKMGPTPLFTLQVRGICLVYLSSCRQSFEKLFTIKSLFPFEAILRAMFITLSYDPRVIPLLIFHEADPRAKSSHLWNSACPWRSRFLPLRCLCCPLPSKELILFLEMLLPLRSWCPLEGTFAIDFLRHFHLGLTISPAGSGSCRVDEKRYNKRVASGQFI